jgi:hypothetical protein
MERVARGLPASLVQRTLIPNAAAHSSQRLRHAQRVIGALGTSARVMCRSLSRHPKKASPARSPVADLEGLRGLHVFASRPVYTDQSETSLDDARPVFGSLHETGPVQHERRPVIWKPRVSVLLHSDYGFLQSNCQINHLFLNITPLNGVSL